MNETDNRRFQSVDYLLGSRIATVGQAQGRAINLMLTTPDGQAIFGVGTAAQPISQCGGVLGGPFGGPQPGDSGDWVIEPNQDDSEPPPPDDGSTEEDGGDSSNDESTPQRSGKPSKGVIV